jgi:hypothetical protein
MKNQKFRYLTTDNQKKYAVKGHIGMTITKFKTSSFIGILILIFSILLNSCSYIKSDSNSSEKTPVLKLIDKSASNWMPSEGYIRNKETAIKVGIVILQSSYSIKKISNQFPFNATLFGDTWIVTGELGEGLVGGVAEIHLDKISGRVLLMKHGK